MTADSLCEPSHLDPFGGMYYHSFNLKLDFTRFLSGGFHETPIILGETHFDGVSKPETAF